MSKIIEIKNLVKSYKEIKAVSDISFCVKEGEIFAFLGLNGAGKSTTINIICGVLAKDSGEVYVNGHNIENELNLVKAEIGIVFQISVLDKLLTVEDNLRLRASMYGINGQAFKERLDELSAMFDFKDLLKRPLGKLSGGQKRRIDIARALIHKPKILILDEPTTGLDPQTRILVWKVIDELRKKDRLTVFLTTHYMEEASDADYVIVIDNGKIAAEGTPLELKNKYSSDYIKLFFTKKNNEKLEKLLIKKELQYQIEHNYFKIAVKDSKEALQIIIPNEALFEDFEIVKGKMDDVFLNVTGKKLGENN